MRSRLSPAMAVATVALVFSATGVSVAALGGAGGTSERGESMTAGAAKSIRGPKGPRGPRGFRGYRGSSGARGAAGPPGIANVRYVDSVSVSLQPGQTTVDILGYGGFKAQCPSGYYVIGTGFDASIGKQAYVAAYNTFVGGFAYNDTSITITDVHLQAVCAQLAPGASVASASAKRREQNRYGGNLRRLQAEVARSAR